MTAAFSPWRFCVAPMMDWTDRHCRVFHRMLSARALLYTEMVTTGALIHGDRARFLAHDPVEHPVALQLGGSDPRELSACARFGADAGYAEINLNVGCPSDRVQSGRFGACLMAESELVADCIAAMKAAVSIPVTVKCRIGIDGDDPHQRLRQFVEIVGKAMPDAFIIHARKAILKGLSPKENRDVPPLDYELVHAIKRENPHFPVIINGGIHTLAEASAHLAHVDGVMLGRAAYQSPAILCGVDAHLFGEGDPVRPEDGLARFMPYVARMLGEGVPLASMTRHILGLFSGRPGARLFRRYLAENAHKRGAGMSVLEGAISLLTSRRAMDDAVAHEMADAS